VDDGERWRKKETKDRKKKKICKTTFSVLKCWASFGKKAQRQLILFFRIPSTVHMLPILSHSPKTIPTLHLSVEVGVVLGQLQNAPSKNYLSPCKLRSKPLSLHSSLFGSSSSTWVSFVVQFLSPLVMFYNFLNLLQVRVLLS